MKKCIKIFDNYAMFLKKTLNIAYICEGILEKELPLL